MATIDEAILNYLYDGTPRTFKEIGQCTFCNHTPRSTVWDALHKLQRKGKVACVRTMDGRKVTWYRVR